MADDRRNRDRSAWFEDDLFAEPDIFAGREPPAAPPPRPSRLRFGGKRAAPTAPDETRAPTGEPGGIYELTEPLVPRREAAPGRPGPSRDRPAPEPPGRAPRNAPRLREHAYPAADPAEPRPNDTYPIRQDEPGDRRFAIDPRRELTAARNAHAIERADYRRLEKRHGGLFASLFGLFKPLIWAAAILLVVYGVVTMGTTYYRSLDSFRQHTAAVHRDDSFLNFDVTRQIPDDGIEFIVRDIDGSVHRVIAERGPAEAFINETLLYLDSQSRAIKQTTAENLDTVFAAAFSDRSAAVETYADWYFEWSRSYVLMKEAVRSAYDHFMEARYETLSEAIDHDMREYFMRHFTAQVLKPELRDPLIEEGGLSTFRQAHDAYRVTVATMDQRLQRFLKEHTTHLEELDPTGQHADIRLDWDAQAWKAPTHLMEDRAFEGFAGIGRIAGSGAAGAVVLAPAVRAVVARTMGRLSTRFTAAVATEVAAAQGGAAAGTAAQPGGGTIVGALIGLAAGAVWDYLANEAHEALTRDEFVATNRQAVDATMTIWRDKMRAEMHRVVDVWIADTRTAAVIDGLAERASPTHDDGVPRHTVTH